MRQQHIGGFELINFERDVELEVKAMEEKNHFQVKIRRIFTQNVEAAQKMSNFLLPLHFLHVNEKNDADQKSPISVTSAIPSKFQYNSCQSMQ